MNGYDLTRQWFNFKFSNPNKLRPIHSELYFYIIDLWNRLGQVDNIGLPTAVTMQSLQIGSYNTYSKVLQDIIDFGFIKLISEAKNQYQSKVIALSINDEATDKALDKAHAKAPDETPDETPDTIIEQRTKNKEQEVYAFSSFWDLYGKKKDTAKCMAKWNKIKNSDKELIKVALPIYISKEKEVKFRKNPLTWLNGSCWLDETHEINVVPELDVKPLVDNEW